MNKEQIVASYMEALGEEKLSEGAWKRIADVNANILDENPNYLNNLPNGNFIRHEDGSLSQAKYEPYQLYGIEWLKCSLGFHELVISKKYRGTKYCFRCGVRKTNLEHY